MEIQTKYLHLSTTSPSAFTYFSVFTIMEAALSNFDAGFSCLKRSAKIQDILKGFYNNQTPFG